jgi:hypothetical protein
MSIARKAICESLNGFFTACVTAIPVVPAFFAAVLVQARPCRSPYRVTLLVFDKLCP